MNSNDPHPNKKSPKSTKQRAQGDRLQSEINALHHELRRVRDGLERAGGVSGALEQRAKQLSENIELCERELMQI